MNLPNKLTILRIILVPFFVLFMLLSGDIFPHHNLVALAIFGIASYTDHLDGKITIQPICTLKQYIILLQR